MTTVIFVHGTGVREKRYAKSFQSFERKVAEHWSGVTVLPCFWGDRLGVPLDAAALTVPDYEISRGGDLPSDDWRDERWILLEADRLYELRLLNAVYSGRRTRSVLPTADVTGEDRLEVFLKWAQALPAAAGVEAVLARVGLPVEVFAAAVRAVFDDPTTRQVIKLVAGGEGDTELREALARAVVAATLVGADAGEAGAFPLDAIGRDDLATVVLDGLDGGDLALGRTLMRVSAELVLNLGIAQAVERRRGKIMDGVTPFGGDVLRYLAHGEPVRRFIADTVGSVRGPVVLVAHSLGGIACVDLLRFGLARVDLLVTVGSQGAYLGSLGALPSAPDGVVPGDAAMPRWVNVYDPRDLLSYRAAPIFGTAVEDVELRSGAPFPRAHSAYFSLDTFYTGLRDRLPR